MKKFTFLAVLCISLVCIKSNAQVTHVKTLPSERYLDFYFANYQESFVENIWENGQVVGVKIYDTDLNLKKTIRLNIPNMITIIPIKQIDPVYDLKTIYFTYDVFNSDELLEFAVTIRDNNNGEENELAIVNENNQVLWSKKWENAAIFQELYLYKILNMFSINIYGTQNNSDFYDYYSYTGNLNPSSLRATKLSESSYPYPNPAKESIQLTYDLQNAQEGTIRVFNINGQEVKSLKVDGNADAVQLKTSGMASGNYFYTVEANGTVVGKNRFIVQ